jgi:hypothetical protein
MSPLLDDDELTALLEKEAFSPPSWQKALFFFALLLFIVALCHCTLQLWQEKHLLPTAKWIELKAGGLLPLQEQAVQHCLQQWGSERGLPVSERVIVRQAASFPPANNSYWYIVWFTPGNSFDFSISGHLREYCQ